MRAAVVIAAVLAAHAAPAAANERLDDRKVVIAGFGILWMNLDGVSGSGMAVQPTYQRTFDRFELQGDYLLADWRDSAEQRPGGTLHRLGLAGRYQIGRARVAREMTLDCVLEAGTGLQYFARDTGDAFARTDVMFGLGLRMLTDVGDQGAKHRAFMGMEAMIRVMLMPRAGRALDAAVLFMFGAPFGW